MACFAIESLTQTMHPPVGAENERISSTTGNNATLTSSPTSAPNSLLSSTSTSGRFGMLGLLDFIKAAETDMSLASVTYGTDLTTLGINLSTQDKLFPSFAGPWADSPLKVYEVDWPVPSEYLVSPVISSKLTRHNLKNYDEDTIFFLFYMFPKDIFQMAAAAELHSRKWRFHTKEKVWITRMSSMPILEKNSEYERGTYYVFEPSNWSRVAKEFILEYKLLEDFSTHQNCSKLLN